MIVSAQWVHNRELELSGPNAFLYGGPERLPLDWNADDQNIEAVVEAARSEPGHLVATRLVVPPGGNDVWAYLDVVSKESIGRRELEDLFSAVHIGSRQLDGDWKSARAIARFRAAQTVVDVVSLIFHRLVDELLEVVTSRESEGPFRIVRQREEDATVYSLDTQSGQRIARILGPGWQQSRVRVGDTEADDFRTLRGEDIEPHILEALLGLPRDAVDRLGGVEFRDEPPGRRDRRV